MCSVLGAGRGRKSASARIRGLSVRCLRLISVAASKKTGISKRGRGPCPYTLLSRSRLRNAVDGADERQSMSEPGGQATSAGHLQCRPRPPCRRLEAWMAADSSRLGEVTSRRHIWRAPVWLTMIAAGAPVICPRQLHSPARPGQVSAQVWADRLSPADESGGERKEGGGFPQRLSRRPTLPVHCGSTASSARDGSCSATTAI